MMSAPNTPRRWFRYSLRTLFVLVAILAVPLSWLAYNLNWIRQRHEAAKIHFVDTSGIAISGGMLGDSPKPPGSLAFFGELGAYHVEITVPNRKDGKLTAAEQTEIQRMQRLFPEAEVYPFADLPSDEPPEDEFAEESQADSETMAEPSDDTSAAPPLPEDDPFNPKLR